MKKKGLIISLSLILAVIIAVFGVLVVTKHSKTKVDDKSEAGGKNITVTVVYEDKTEKEFEIETDAKNLGDAIFEEKMVSEEEHKTGFYTVIDGVRADYTLDGAWWCFTQEGEMTNAGANDLPIKDGDQFEITHTPA